jgi:hypothetical protein
MLDKLKAFFNGEVNLPQLKKLAEFKDVELKVASGNTGNSLLTINNNKTDKSVKVIVNINSGEVKDANLLAEQLGKLLTEHRQEEKKPVFEIEAQATVSSLQQDKTYEEEVSYFTGKIPSSDMSVLRAAYFIKSQNEKGLKVINLVKDVRIEHGTRGANIVNLVGRDYFETYMKPMYEMLSNRPNFELSMFTDNYELIVNNAPFAYFVNSAQTVEDLAEGISEKIRFGRSYGQHTLAVHAIGSVNISNAQEAIKLPAIASLIREDIDIDVQRSVMTMNLYYKD